MEKLRLLDLLVVATVIAVLLAAAKAQLPAYSARQFTASTAAAP